jgi:hypothetical protein
MALLLDAYMQWFHIGSYRLAVFFSQRGGLVYPTGKLPFEDDTEISSSSRQWGFLENQACK